MTRGSLIVALCPVVALAARVRPSYTRASLLRKGIAAITVTVIPVDLAAADESDLSDMLMARFADPSPKQLSASFTDALSSSFNRVDNLIFPAWMEGNWVLTSRPLANSAPLGRRYLPSDLSRMRLGDLSNISASPLTYTVRFFKRPSDGAVVSDRASNLQSVQDAAAGYARVESVEFDGAGKLSVRYSPFGRNGTFPGPSRSEIYINWRRQSKPSSSGAFVFSEATRTVYLAPAQQRELSTISDAETLCRFERLDADTIAGRQRVLRYLTPNPNSAEGVLWGETNGRAVATLEYEFLLRRVPGGPSAL